MSLDGAARLWALLWAHGDPISIEILCEWLSQSPAELEETIAILGTRLQETPFEILRVAGGLEIVAGREGTRFLDEVAGRRGPEPLSQAAWETLAVIAWRQPITRLEIDGLRQVTSERALETLQHRGLVEQVGRRETVGRPILYGTTPEFLRQFGLRSLDDLPPGPDSDPHQNEAPAG